MHPSRMMARWSGRHTPIVAVTSLERANSSVIAPAAFICPGGRWYSSTSLQQHRYLRLARAAFTNRPDSFGRLEFDAHRIDGQAHRIRETVAHRSSKIFQLRPLEDDRGINIYHAI